MSHYHVLVYSKAGDLIETDIFSKETDAADYRLRVKARPNVGMVVVKYR